MEDGRWKLVDESFKMEDGRRRTRSIEGWRKKYKGVEGGV